MRIFISVLLAFLLISGSTYSRDKVKYGFGVDFTLHDESNLDKYGLSSIDFQSGHKFHTTILPSFFVVLNDRSILGGNFGLGFNKSKLVTTEYETTVDSKQRSFILGVFYKYDLLIISRTRVYVKPQIKYREFDHTLDYFLDMNDERPRAYSGNKYHSMDINLGLGIEHKISQKIFINLMVSNDILSSEKEIPRVSNRFESRRWVSFKNFLYYSLGVKVIM